MINIKQLSDCCGCTACESICSHGAIRLQPDKMGFKYPVIDKNACIGCGLCEKVCPIINRDKELHQKHPESAYALYLNDEENRMRSSSGGAFYAIFDNALKQGWHVIGAAYADDMHVEHRVASNKKECIAFMGSKYSQSDLSSIYKKCKQMLTGGGITILFSGTPCQIEGLKKYLRKPYPNLYTCDLVCHYVPSPKVFSDYVTYIENKYKDKVVDIRMKDKTNGWTHPETRVVFRNRKDLFLTYDSILWGRIFSSMLSARPSCLQCRFANMNRVGDITIGDFWGVNKTHPEMFDERGCSLVMVNTEKGRTIFDMIKKDCEYVEAKLNECIQPRLQSPCPEPERYDEFMRDYNALSFKQLKKNISVQ